MPSKKAPKKPGFAMFGSNDPTIEGDSPPIVEDDSQNLIAQDDP
jgi:hypothetical protein